MRRSIYWFAVTAVITVVALFGAGALTSGCVETTLLYCDDDRACQSAPARSHCDVERHVCVAPIPIGTLDLSGVDLPDGADLAAPDLTTIVSCTQAIDCTDDALPICGASGQCEPCKSDLDDTICALHDPATPRCRLTGAGAGTCSACRTPTANSQSADCSDVTQPICTADGACRVCRAHSECDSGLCDFGEGGQAGRCIPASDIVYVDNRDIAVATCKTMYNTMQKGTAAEPYCDIDQAIDAVATRPILWIKVAPHASVYGLLDLTNVTHGKVVINAPGATVDGTSANPLVNVSSANLELAIEGLTLGSAAGGESCLVSMMAQAIRLRDLTLTHCATYGVRVGANGGTLTAERVKVLNGAGIGFSIESADATVRDSQVIGCDGLGIEVLGTGSTLDGVLVQANTGGGIELAPSTVSTIVNCAIVGNGNDNSLSGDPVTDFGGIWARGTLRLINSTLTGNEADPAFAQQLRCVDGNAVALNSVLVNKDGSSAAPQSNVCVLHASAFAFGAAPVNDNVTLTGCTASDVFVRPSAPLDLHPRKDAKDGCKLIDLGKASAAGLTAPMVDFDDAMRPQGGGYEIGAFEVMP